MGILDQIKQRRTQREAVRLERQFTQKAMAMSAEKLWQLTNDELLEAILARMQAATKGMNEKEAFGVLNEVQRHVYVLKVFDEEVQTGGLLQFFVNDSRDLAPFVSSALAEAKAEPYTTIFDDFVERNNIDLRDLSSFKIDDISEYEENIGRYPFDDFDSAFYYENLKNPLERMIMIYIRENISQL